MIYTSTAQIYSQQTSIINTPFLIVQSKVFPVQRAAHSGSSTPGLLSPSGSASAQAACWRWWRTRVYIQSANHCSIYGRFDANPVFGNEAWPFVMPLNWVDREFIELHLLNRLFNKVCMQTYCLERAEQTRYPSHSTGLYNVQRRQKVKTWSYEHILHGKAGVWTHIGSTGPLWDKGKH